MTDPERQKRGRNSKARGKSVERQVAKMLGGQRIPDGVGHGDIQTIGAVYEVKSHMRTSPKELLHAFEQVEEAARITGKDVGGVVNTYVDNGKRVFYLVTKLEGC
jgi:hypothetical protein